MSIKKNIFLALSILCLAFSSCQNDASIAEDAIINIPSSSSSVTSFDLKSLMDKADFDEVQKMTFYKDAVKDVVQGNPSLAAVLNNPAESGVDLESKIYLSQEVNVVDPTQSFNCVLLTLKDKAAFKTLMTSSSSASVSSGSGYEYFSPSRGVTIGWSDQLAVIALAQGSGADLKSGLDKIYATTKETSVAQNDNLKQCFSKSADVISWFNSEPLAEASKGEMGMAMAMAGFSADMLKDNFIHSYFNFENGEIVSNSEYQINEKLAKEYRHIFKDEVKTDFSKYLPAENLAFAVTTGLDSRGMKMILDGKGMSGMADFQLKEFGLSMDGLTKTFDGDLLVSGYRVDGQKNPTMLLATKINDMDYLKKIIDLGIEYNSLIDKGDGVYGIADMNALDDFGRTPQLYVSGDMLFLGDASTTVEKMKSGEWGKSKLVGGEIKKVVSDNIFGAFADFQTIAQLIDMGNIDLNGIKNGIMRMDRDDSTFKVEMTDKNTNSLKSIFNMLNDNYKK